MLYYVLHVKIPHGSDEFWGGVDLSGLAGPQEVVDMIKRCLAGYGFYDDYGLEVEFIDTVEDSA